jgi:hypothetical protein
MITPGVVTIGSKQSASAKNDGTADIFLSEVRDLESGNNGSISR